MRGNKQGKLINNSVSLLLEKRALNETAGSISQHWSGNLKQPRPPKITAYFPTASGRKPDILRQEKVPTHQRRLLVRGDVERPVARELRGPAVRHHLLPDRGHLAAEPLLVDRPAGHRISAEDPQRAEVRHAHDAEGSHLEEQVRQRGVEGVWHHRLFGFRRRSHLLLAFYPHLCVALQPAVAFGGILFRRYTCQCSGLLCAEPLRF